MQPQGVYPHFSQGTVILNANETIGYYFLATEDATAGKLIYNPQYVERIGRYISRLKLLKYRVPDQTHRAHLEECYQNQLFSAVFWAVYPKDVSTLTSDEKKRIQANLNIRRKQKQPD